MGDGLAEVDFGPYRLAPLQRMLTRDGRPVPLGSRAFDILVALVQAQREVLSKDALTRLV